MSDDLAGLDRTRLQDVLADGPLPLFATISGAHLYGFASPDSDVDLRGAFVLPLEEALGLRDPKETITISRDEGGMELDWVAHDVRKFARLMTRNNGYVLEQLYSPLVVHGGPWHDELRGLGPGCMTKRLVHHYRGFARNQRKLLGRETPTVKQLLYAYRVLLTGIHVLRSAEIEANLEVLLRHYPTPGVDALIERKRTGDEKGALEAGELEAHAPTLDALATRMEEAHDRSELPNDCTNYDALSDYVVRARLELGRG